MRFAIGERKRAAPRPSEDGPLVDAEMRTQLLHVGDQVRGGIAGEFTVWTRAAGTALVEDHDAIVRRIEEAPVHRARAGARSAVHEHHWHAVVVSRYLPVHLVVLVQPEIAGMMWLYVRIKFGADSWGGMVHAIGPGGRSSNHEICNSVESRADASRATLSSERPHLVAFVRKDLKDAVPSQQMCCADGDEMRIGSF